MTQKNWIPEIMYEESSGDGASNLPFIQVPAGEEMPKLLFMFESRQTDETEPGPEGEDLPVFEWDLHQYADMAVLKESLRPELFDEVRVSLGLQPLAEAAAAGQQISQNVRNTLEE
tara:strand:- start:24 stop:371 length:348 start_codon:yes stop_codon:yes gene_type:complete